MEQGERKTRVKEVLETISHWFGPGGSQEEGSGGSGGAPGPSGGDLGGRISPEGGQARSGASVASQANARKLAVLKRALRFEPDLGSRLDEVHSSKDLLVYLRDVLLLRFNELCKVGLVNAESSKVLDSIDAKVSALLDSRGSSEFEGERDDAEELRCENEELKQRIEHLHAIYANGAMVNERERAYEKEIKFLQGKLKEYQDQLSAAAARFKVLYSYRTMLEKYKAKNGMLASKVEQQERLLRSLTAENPNHRELVSRLQQLSEENKELRMKLETQSDLLEKLKTRLPPEVRKVVDDLISKNMKLQADLQDRNIQLEGTVASGDAGKDLLGQIDRLSEENIQLRNSLEAKELIENFISDPKKEGSDPGRMIETLRMENWRLEQALRNKEEQIELLMSDPANRELLKAYNRLKEEYRQVFKENRHNATLYNEEKKETQRLLAEIEEKNALIQENEALKAELESLRINAQKDTASDRELQELHSQLIDTRAKYQSTLEELNDANSQLATLKHEYEVLVKEYENIYNNRE